MQNFESFVGVDLLTALFKLCNMLFTFLILKKLLFKPVKKMIDDRQKEIADQYAEAERRRQEAEQAKLAYDQEIAQAKQKRDEIVREAAELAHRQERDILNAAREEAKAITAKAHSDIRQERRKVFNEMKTEISDIAIEIAEKVTEKEIDSDKHRELIDSFIDQIGEAS